MLKHLFLLIVLAVSYYIWDQRPIQPEDGILAPEAPELIRTNRAPAIEKDGMMLHPRWRIEGTSRVLANRRYWIDTHASLAPVDAVLGWKGLSDNLTLSQVKTPVRNREFRLDVIRPRMTLSEIRENLMLMHAIPSDESVRSKLLDIRKGHVISYSGYIVDAGYADLITWESDFTPGSSRLDGGQIVYIERLEIQ